MSELTTLLLKLPRNTEVTPEAAQMFLSALSQINTVGILKKITGVKPQNLALEITSKEQQIMFLITCDSDLVPFVTTQIQSSYPLVIIEKIIDPLEQIQPNNLYFTSFKLTSGSFYPLANYNEFKEVDPMSSLLSVMSKAKEGELTTIQLALTGAGSSWQSKGQGIIDRGVKKEDGTQASHPDEASIKEKISQPGFKCSIKIASTSSPTLHELINTFAIFSKSGSNRLKAKSPKMKTKFFNNLIQRKATDNQVLNSQELATIWHLPSDKIKTTSIVWGTSVLSEAPANLPVSTDLDSNQKQNINFFAKTQYKNQNTIFGIKGDDRRRHIWCIGKTGTGKSTLIANMAIDDLKKGRGMAVIDPHGDLCEVLLDYIPKSRINDTIYFNPADKNFPININPLEVTNSQEAELVVSGLMAIFTKVWANVWSARMEYILRNAFMTLAQVENTTLEDVLKLLSNQSYRNKILTKIDDESLVRYWKEEFDKMPERLQKEAISPIQNKVGQFVTSPLVRRIIGKPKSAISIDDIMNEGKILLVNLTQGKLGEDNSALLGAMLITKIQVSTMHRVDIPENQRKDFYLFVDEFQNFATDSFIKILSEARKYRLNLMLANQYMAQIPEPIQKAILGNAGSIVTFTSGADDAQIIHKEFSEVFSQNDLVNLMRYQVAIKLMIDGHSSRPFLANTLPLPASRNQNREKVIAVSRERWAKKIKKPPN